MYAALAGYQLYGYQVSLGRTKRTGLRHFFVIVANNILIAAVSDFESAYHFFALVSRHGLPRGSHAVAGWNNVFGRHRGFGLCMTAWWNVYSSKDGHDMLCLT